MNLHVQCPGCQSPCTVTESMLGKRVRCPKCAEVFTATAATVLNEGILAGTAPMPAARAQRSVESGTAERSIVRRGRSYLPWALGGGAAALLVLCGVGALGAVMVWTHWAERAPIPQAGPAAAEGPPLAGKAELPPAKADGAGADTGPKWTMDLQKMVPPDQPLAGKILGVNFKPTSVQLQSNGLDLQSGKNHIRISLIFRPGKSVYEFSAEWQPPWLAS
jgi:predicted Zn finger-like uncharacterized protein